MRLHSTIRKSGSVLIWILDGHQIDFTPDEFRDMIAAVRGRGLFEYLKRERPSLHSRLIQILKQGCDAVRIPFEEINAEHLLEQLIVDLERRIYR
jgi:hypothetical protein